MGFVWFSEYVAIISLSSINEFIFVMGMCNVSFEGGTELDSFYASHG
jgi:hypothetical protein